MLQIEPVIEQADGIVERVQRELPTHPGLLSTARHTAEAAREAQRVSRRLGRTFGLHRLPALFLLAALLAVAIWSWWHFLHTSSVTVAVSDQDAIDLGHELSHRVQFVRVTTPGSRESLDRLLRGEVDMAFVQGGIPIPRELQRVELPTPEVVLFFVRSSISRPSDIRTMLTSSRGQGSHSLARELARFWRIDGRVRYVHQWKTLVGNPTYRIPAEVDAVFVVKDPMDRRIAPVSRRLQQAGFRMAPVDFGAATVGLPCLVPTQLTAGFVDPVNVIPSQPVQSYLVKTYLVARPGLAPRQLAAARRLADPSANTMETSGTLSSVEETSELLQGVEAFLGILIYIGLAFLAMLGIDIVVYRRRFHELNSLISLVAIHQANKDVLGRDPAAKAHDIAYLHLCSDVLGLISAITGYYAQENSSLLYNKLLEIIPQRCDGLKINIQLKILHAGIDLPVP